MLVKERSTRRLLTLFGRELRLHRYWTMDEDIMTGKVTNRKLHEFSSRTKNQRHAARPWFRLESSQ